MLATLATLTVVPAALAGQPHAPFAPPDTNAGYLFHRHGVHSITAHFVVPRVTCPVDGAGLEIRVGIGDARADTWAAIGVHVVCRGGKPVYHAFDSSSLGPGGNRIPGPTRPGDQIQVGISGDADGYNASISNLTRLWGSETFSFFGVDPTEVGGFVTERARADGELRPLADFGSFALTDLAIGKGDLSGDVVRLSMEPPSEDPKVQTSVLDREGRSFSLTWLRS